MEVHFVVANAENTNTLVVTNSSSVVPNEPVVSSVVTSTKDTVVLTQFEQQVIQAGQVGPRGQSAEDIDMYSKRVDFVNDTVIYKAEAVPGTLPSWPKWRIHKLVLAEDGDVIETWANGSALFDKVWNDRANYEYL